MIKFIKILTLGMMFVAALCSDAVAQTAGQFAADSAYLCQPFSAMDVMTLSRMEQDADRYKDEPGYTVYKEKLGRASEDLTVYDRAVNALNSPFDFNRIVEVRKQLIPLITSEGYFSEAQQSEMDRLDILLSRYKGSVMLFQDIISRINKDAVVISYRAAAKKGRPSGEERRKYIAAISAVVYKPTTKQFTDEINNYIELIPYLKPLLTEYLNSIAQYPETVPAVESEITAIKL